MAKAGQKFDRSVTRIQTSLGRMEDKFKSAGAKMANLQTGLASLGAGVFLKSTLDEAKQFQQALNLTKAVTGSTGDQMDIMRAKALEWGSSTQFSSLQVSQAMAELGKMGNKANQIIDLMPGTMALAAAGEISMAEAATYTMQTINQMGLQLSDAGMVADTFATGAANASTSVTGMSLAFTNVGLTARGVGLDLNTTSVALMALASQGQEGAVGGTMLKNALLEIQKMTPKVRKGFEGMGIDIDNFRDSTTGQITDLYGFVDALKATGDTGTKALGEMFGKQALQGLKALVGTTTEDMDKFRLAMENVEGGAEKMAGTLLEDLEVFTVFESLMGNLKVIMGTFVLEALTPVLKKFNGILGNLQQNNPEFLRMITNILMIVTAVGAVLIPLGLFISAIGSLFGAIKLAMGVTKLFGVAQAVFAGIMGLSGTSIATTTAATTAYVIGTKIAAAGQWLWNAAVAAFPVILIVTAIAAVVAGIIWMAKNWDFVKAKMKEWGLAALGFIQNVWDKISELLDSPFFVAAGLIFAPWLTIPALILKHWEPIKAFFIDLWDKLQPIVEGVGGFFGGIGDFFTGGGDPSEYTGDPRGRTRQPEAPTPGGGRRGANATANATVSVYTEKGMGVTPYEAEGNLGYNMVETSSRGRR